MRKKLIFILLLILFGCSYETETISYNEKKEPARFTCSESFPVFHHEAGYSCYGKILTDKKTGIKYLYIWDGMGNGGPALTRYYEKP